MIDGQNKTAQYLSFVSIASILTLAKRIHWLWSLSVLEAMKQIFQRVEMKEVPQNFTDPNRRHFYKELDLQHQRSIPSEIAFH